MDIVAMILVGALGLAIGLLVAYLVMKAAVRDGILEADERRAETTRMRSSVAASRASIDDEGHIVPDPERLRRSLEESRARIDDEGHIARP